jgi:hypothetical protein
MPTKKKRTKFTLDIYDSVVEVHVVKGEEEVAKKAAQLHKKYKEEPIDETHIRGFVYTHDFGTYKIILCEESMCINTITHEVDHVRQFILDHHGVKDQESSANLAGYINERVFQFLQNAGYKITY